MNADQKRFLRLITTVQNAYRQAVYSALRKQVNFFADNYAKGVIDFNLPKKPIVKVLRQLYEDAGVNNALFVQRQLKRDIKKSVSDDINRFEWSMNEYFRTHLLEKSTRQITETTKRQLLAVLQKSTDEGWGVSKTVTALKDTDLTRSRAELIVRTETMKAANVGAMIAAADMGIIVQKKWISAQDERTRRIPRDQYDHLYMNGIVKDFDQAFIVPSTKTLDSMQYPGDPNGSAGNVCNCRCTVSFIPLKDANNRPIPISREDTGTPIEIGETIVRPVVVENPFLQIVNSAKDILINNSIVNGLRKLIENFFDE